MLFRSDKFSIATVQSRSGDFGRGDKVVSNKAPEPLRYADGWGNGGGGGGSSNASNNRR